MMCIPALATKVLQDIQLNCQTDDHKKSDITRQNPEPSWCGKSCNAIWQLGHITLSQNVKMKCIRMILLSIQSHLQSIYWKIWCEYHLKPQRWCCKASLPFSQSNINFIGVVLSCTRLLNWSVHVLIFSCWATSGFPVPQIQNGQV